MHRHDKPDSSIISVKRNPYNSNKYVILIAGTDAANTRLALEKVFSKILENSVAEIGENTEKFIADIALNLIPGYSCLERLILVCR